MTLNNPKNIRRKSALTRLEVQLVNFKNDNNIKITRVGKEVSYEKEISRMEFEINRLKELIIC